MGIEGTTIEYPDEVITPSKWPQLVKSLCQKQIALKLSHP